MSAYDNPTIIKDDTAMAWAQSLGNVGQAFTESFNIARKEREAKEKEARLEAERKAQEGKQDALNKQIFDSDQSYKYEIRKEQINDGLLKAGTDASGTALVNDWYTNTANVEGDANTQNRFEVLSKEQREKNKAYSGQRMDGERNLTRVTGGLYSQAGAIRSGEINMTNIDQYRFNGQNVMEQTLNRITTYALAYPDDSKTKKELIYDAKGDPSDITLKVTTKVGSRKELIETLRKTNPAKDITDADLEKQIEEGLKKENPDIIMTGTGENAEYSFNFVRKINSDYDGIMYTKIPQVEFGEAPVTAGVYTKDNGTEISGIYMSKPEFAKVEGNSKLAKERGTVMYQRSKVDMKSIEVAMMPSLIAKAEGLLASYFQDPNTANGILQELDYGTNYPFTSFRDGKGTKEQAEELAKRMLKKEVENIVAKSQLKKIGEEYYKEDNDVRIFENLSSGSGSGSSGEQTQKEIEKEKQLKAEVDKVLAIKKGEEGRMEFGKNKVAHIDNQFIVETPGELQGRVIPTIAGVINFLKNGTYNPKPVAKKQKK